MKICIIVPSASRFQTPEQMQEVDQKISQCQGARFARGKDGLPLQNEDGSWTVYAQEQSVGSLQFLLRSSCGFTVVPEREPELPPRGYNENEQIIS